MHYAVPECDKAKQSKYYMFSVKGKSWLREPKEGFEKFNKFRLSCITKEWMEDTPSKIFKPRCKDYIAGNDMYQGGGHIYGFKTYG